MAVDVKKSEKELETLCAIRRIAECERQIILRGHLAKDEPSLMSYAEKVGLDMRLALTEEEAEMPLHKLIERFAELPQIKFPSGNLEYLTSTFNGRRFLVVYYHIFSKELGISFYTQLKEAYFDEK